MQQDIMVINILSDAQIKALINELKKYDVKVEDKIKYALSSANLTLQEATEYVVTATPKLWAAVYLNWEARDYQDAILEAGKKNNKVVLRLGRRLGKTETMCILILWHACTQINKGPNNQYDILIITPYETQVDLIFDRLKQLIDQSPYLKSIITRDVHHRLELNNGTKIVGLTAGTKSGTGAANTRGQRADLIVLDEVDYMGSPEITNIINIRNEAPERIKILAASTPSGRREEFYNWCTYASKKFYPSEDDIKNFRFSGYLEKSNSKGNGWVEIYAPSIVNRELLKINPYTNKTYIQDLKDELSEMRFIQEVLAEFGDEEAGVYQKKYIEMAIQEGQRINHKYTTEMDEREFNEFISRHKFGARILGVDWDKYAASTNMVCVELDNLHRDVDGNIYPVFKVLFRVEIPRTEFTYINAVNKIIELNKIYDFDWIAVDRGYGETQIELLHKYGLENPLSGLHEKVIGYQFSEKIEVRDPYTLKKDKKPLKPFMVNNSVIVFEKGRIVLNPNDKKFIQQLEQYRVKSISTNGMPTFSDQNEHIVDAMNLCLLTFEQRYGELFRNIISNKIYSISNLTFRDNVVNRSMLVENEKHYSFTNISNNIYSYNKASRGMMNKPKPFSRRMF